MADTKTSTGQTITVCSKLPFDFKAEFGGKTVVFKGGNGKDHTGEAYLTGAYGLTPNVDSDWYMGWEEQVGDFMPVKNGAIFASSSKDPAAEAAEKQAEVKTGLEQKTEDELGVQVVADKK